MAERLTKEDFYFNPDSKLLKVDRENAIVVFGGQRALFMQLANPLVCEAVYQHSYFKENAPKRLQHTIELTYSLLFGTKAEVADAARKINHAHVPVHGTLKEDNGIYRAGEHYDARDPRLSQWVWATLVDSALVVQNKFIKQLSPQDSETYYQESKNLLPLVGGKPDEAPQTYQDFNNHIQDMISSGKLTVGDEARELAPYLMLKNDPIGKLVALPASRAAIGLLPKEIRKQYGFQFSAWEQHVLDKVASVSRTVHPYLPDIVRYSPKYMSAQRRMGR